jgi:hypothetical protein
MHDYDPNWMEGTVPSPRTAGVGAPGEGGSGLGGIPARIWVLGALVGVVAVAVVALWAVYLLRGQSPSGGPTPAPIIWTPTPAPTSPPPTPVPTETAAPPPTASPDIAIGVYVRVTGTGDVGLSLREGPGPTYPRVDIALEGEVFIVVDGPKPAGGYDWWKVRDPDNAEREWWGAGNFLEPVAHP